MSKPDGVYLASRGTNTGTTSNKAETNSSIKKASAMKLTQLTDKTLTKKSKKTKSAKSIDSQIKQASTPTTVNLSSANIAQLLSQFMNLRSSIRNMSDSVKTVEKWLDNTYGMFEMAQLVLKSAKNNRATIKQAEDNASTTPLLNLSKKADSNKNSSHSIAPLLQNIDLGKIVGVMRSPVFQKIISNILKK